MIKDFIKECLNQAKEEYFNEDHHYYAGQAGKDLDCGIRNTNGMNLALPL